MPVVRILSWNVHGSARPDAGALGRSIREFTPDVVALQEVPPRQAVAVARAAGVASPLWSLKHLPYGPLWWRAEGLALLTSLPQERGRAFPLNQGVHPFTYRRRIAQRLEVHAAGFVLRCWNIHLASDADGGDDRRRQAERLVDYEQALRAEVRDDGRTVLTVVMGDCNDGPDPAVRQVLGGLGLRDAGEHAARRLGRPDGFTSPASGPYQCLDRVLADERLGIEEVLVPEDDGALAGLSDHLPVLVTVRLPDR
jgi:endonuclease/exonuclease/phosphatase family metal-dependent hydrolase